MKINRLSLQNFRNHERTEIMLDSINIMVGKNAAGKSSIKHAIEYLLTGRVTGLTDEAGRGAAEVLPRHGSGEAVVQAEIEGLGTVTRSTRGGLKVEIPDDIYVDDLHGPDKNHQAFLELRLGASRDVISAAINTGRFLSLPPAEQKALLFRLLGLSFTTEKILEYLNDWPDVSDNEIRVFKNLVIGQVVGGPEVFDKLYKLFYNERTGAKRALKELEAMAKQDDGRVELPPGAWEQREKIREDLQALKSRRSLLMKQLGEVNMKARYRQDLASNIPRLEREKRELEERLAAFTWEEVAERDTDKEIADEIKHLEMEKKELQELADAVRGLVADLKAAVVRNEKLIQTLQEAGDSCPLSEDLSCPADKTKIAEEVAVETERVRKALEEEEVRQAELEDKIAAIKKELQMLQQRRQETSEKLGQLDLDRKRLADVEERLEFFRQQLANMEDIRPPAELEEEVDALGQRIAAGEELVQRLAVEESRRKEREKLAARVEQARAEVEALEILVELFGPKGLRQRLLADVLDRLQARADERMQLLTGGEYRVQFSAEGKDGFAVTVFRNGIPRSATQLSTSERLRLGVVMQDILNGLTGLGLLVVDDAETLDPANKMALVNMLLQIRGEYGTIIVLSALGETAPRNPGIPGLAMFLVEDGTVRPVPAPTAMTA